MKFQRELLLIFRAFQFFGFSPFPVPLNVKTLKANQYKWYIYNAIVIIIFAALVLHNMISYKRFLEGDGTQMLTYLSFITINLVRWIAIAIAIESVINSKQQIEFLLKLDKIDGIFLDDLGIKLDYKRMRNIALFWLALWLFKSIALIIMVLLDVFKYDIGLWDKFMWFFLTVPLVISAIRYFQIIQYIRSLGYRFKTINMRLSEIYESTYRLHTGEKRTNKRNAETLAGENTCSNDEEIYDDIVTLRRIFHILWECTGLLNKSFRWSLLLLTATSFIIIVVNYYRTLVWLLIDRNKEENSLVLMYFVWSCGHVFYFIKLSSTCYHVLQEVKLFYSFLLWTMCIKSIDSALCIRLTCLFF